MKIVVIMFLIGYLYLIRIPSHPYLAGLALGRKNGLNSPIPYDYHGLRF